MREDTKDLLMFGGGGGWSASISVGCCLLIVLAFSGVVFTIAAAIRWVIQ